MSEENGKVKLYEEGTLENTAQVAASGTWSVPIPRATVENGALNEIYVVNNSTEDISVYVGGSSSFYYVIGAGGYVSLEKKDKKFFTIVEITNRSAANAIAANKLIVTYRRVV